MLSASFLEQKKEEKKKELDESEIEIINEIYNDLNIVKYLNNEIEKSSNNFKVIFEKIESFLSNISFNFEFSKFQLDIENQNKKYDFNLFINSMKIILNYINKESDFKFIINDIGYKNNKSFCNEKNSENAIELIKDKNNFFDLKLGFENFEINVDEFFGIFLFFQSFKQNKEQKIFKENLIELNKNEHEDIKNKDINKLSNFTFTNNFKL